MTFCLWYHLSNDLVCDFFGISHTLLWLQVTLASTNKCKLLKLDL